MDPFIIAAIISAIVIVVLSVVFLKIFSVKTPAGARPRAAAPRDGAPGRVQAVRNQRARMRANAARHQNALLEEDPQMAEEADEDGPAETVNELEFDDKMGAKKRAKLEAKLEKKKAREAEEHFRREKKQKEEKIEEERKKAQEKEEEEERKREEAERKAEEERKRREQAEYEAMKAAFSVEGEGFEETDDGEKENLLKSFVDYIKLDMAPLTLEGETLGKRQCHLNKLVSDALAKKPPFIAIKVKEEKSDVDKLFKIDIASKCRIVDYILDIFKSNDMLHVSRAIKQSTWLVTDRQYCHIVNPQYLNDVLFPEMTAKASCKFMLHVRLNLKDEKRVEQFYKYYEGKDLLKIALKWLPNCSLEFIKEVVAKKTKHIDKDLFRRLGERSIAILELIVEKGEGIIRSSDYAKSVIFLLRTDIERYLDVVEKLSDVHHFQFGPKQTELILKKCPKRIMEKFDVYAFSIDAASLGKHVGKAKALDFLIKHVKNERISSWFTCDNVMNFLGIMSQEEKFEIIKKVFFSDKIAKRSDDQSRSEAPFQQDSFCLKMMHSNKKKYPWSPNTNIYLWYKHAPFAIAFTQLKKLISAESSPEERVAMMSVILVAAGSNMKHVDEVLQYYHERHINEPLKFRLQFVNNLLASANTHRFDTKSWKLLEALFHSIEVYSETGNRVTNCVNSIVLYKVMHDESVPEAIEKKFIFHSFKEFIKKLSSHEKHLLFKYLYDYIEQKLNQQVITKQEEFNAAISLVEDFFNLLLDWKKELIDYPVLLQKVKEIISMKKGKSWTSCTALFVKKKSWRKQLFEESLLLSPSEETCLNALKHDPDLLKRFASEIYALRYNVKVSLKKFLNKLRVYWPSLASEWATEYRSRLQQSSHTAIIRALCIVLPPEELLPIIKKYAPESDKITWSDSDKLVELNLQKSIAKNMHMARPQPPPEAVLWYAKGDYLQFALPSFSAIFYNLSAVRCRRYFPQLLEAPVSVQKHGIRIACSKMNFEEAKRMFIKVWASTKNSSIRAVIFQLTHNLLCREKSPENAEDLWQLLEILIDNLTDEENKVIYCLMGKVNLAPLHIRPKYLMKSYKFLKSLPAKYECDHLADSLFCHTLMIMEKMDPEFMKDIITHDHFQQHYVHDKCLKFSYGLYPDVIASYVLWGRTEEAQIQRYRDVIIPIMSYVFSRWNEVHNGLYVFRNEFIGLLNSLYEFHRDNVLRKEIEVPVKVFRDVLNKMQNTLLLSKNYMLIRTWTFKVAFVEHSALVRSKFELPKSADFCNGADNGAAVFGEDNRLWNDLCIKLISDFSDQCIRYLKEDITTSSTLCMPFAQAFYDMLVTISFNPSFHGTILEVFLADEEFIEGYVVALRVIKKYFNNTYWKEHLQKIGAHRSPLIQILYNMKSRDDPEFL